MNQKKLKFLVDLGVSKKVEEWLFRNGNDLKAVRDINRSTEFTLIFQGNIWYLLPVSMTHDS